MSAGDPARQKQIKIKTGVIKRYSKEKSMYEKEAKDQEAKIERMKTEGKDEHDIKKQREVLQESITMIPDCKRRYQKALQELDEDLKKNEDLKDTEEYIAALEMMEATKHTLN